MATSESELVDDEAVHEVPSSYMPEGMPLPMASPDGLDTEFWDATKRHELVVQRCNACGKLQFGPEWICHQCYSSDLGWTKVEPRGKIYSWERPWHPVHPALKDFGPYIVVLVELPGAENLRMIGNLLGDPLQDVVIGADVVAEFEDHEDGPTLVQWRYAN